MPPSLKQRFGNRLSVSLKESPSLVLALQKNEDGVREAQEVLRALAEAE